MIVWGGRASDDYLGDGGRYNPEADIWTSITTNGAPRGRAYNAVAWTGKEMIVWGGFGWILPKTDRFRADGARYDLDRDEWKPISSDGAPPAGPGFCSAWTGKVLI